MISMLSIYDITTTIFDIVSTLSLSSHPIYWWYHTNCIYEISSTIYDDIISIVYNSIFTIFVTSQPLYLCLAPTLSMISHPLYVWHYNHYMLTSYTLHKVSHLRFMTSHHIIYDITGTVFVTSLTEYLALHALHLCHHNHSIYDLCPTVCMISHPLYIWHLIHHT